MRREREREKFIICKVLLKCLPPPHRKMACLEKIPVSFKEEIEKSLNIILCGVPLKSVDGQRTGLLS